MATLLFTFRIIEAVFLYAFFFGVVYLLYKALRDKFSLVSPTAIQVSLIRLDDAGMETRKQVFQKPNISIGRGMDCDVRIDHPTVSSLHARLTNIKDQWWLHDERSTNGTFVNEQIIDQPTVLIDSDEIKIGDQRILFHVENIISKGENYGK